MRTNTNQQLNQNNGPEVTTPVTTRLTNSKEQSVKSKTQSVNCELQNADGKEQTAERESVKSKGRNVLCKAQKAEREALLPRPRFNFLKKVLRAYGNDALKAFQVLKAKGEAANEFSLWKALTRAKADNMKYPHLWKAIDEAKATPEDALPLGGRPIEMRRTTKLCWLAIDANGGMPTSIPQEAVADLLDNCSSWQGGELLGAIAQEGAIKAWEKGGPRRATTWVRPVEHGASDDDSVF
jgi:hypothetical protein